MEGGSRRRARRCPRHCGVEVGRHEPEIRRGQFPPAWVACGIAQRLQLLEVGQLADVDLHGQVPADGLLERLSWLEVATGEGPGACEWLHGALPHERLQDARANLEDDGERCLRRRDSARLVHRLSPQRLKLHSVCRANNPLRSRRHRRRHRGPLRRAVRRRRGGRAAALQGAAPLVRELPRAGRRGSGDGAGRQPRAARGGHHARRPWAVPGERRPRARRGGTRAGCRPA